MSVQEMQHKLASKGLGHGEVANGLGASLVSGDIVCVTGNIAPMGLKDMI